MELFDKKFVHFMWDDELKGKTCFVADNINTLIECVEKGTATYKVHWSGNIGMPIERDDLTCYHFAYYDPNYKVKKAFNEGRKVQVKRIDCFDDWVDCDEPIWSEKCNYRVKPEEEKKFRPYESSAEMIADFIDRFKVNCPPYCEPLIWLKGKSTDKRSLVIGFSPKNNKICVDGGRCDLLSLFTLYTYLNGSPCGMEVKE